MINNYPKSRETNLVVQDFENEILIYDLEINKAFCLNHTSSLVWKLCDGQNSIAEISRKISLTLKKSASEELVWLALDSLKKNELLEKSSEFETNFKGLNRRQVIKKVGLDSMIALPLISSIVAPNAATAQSTTGTLALHSRCTSSSECISGNCFEDRFGRRFCCAATTTTAGFVPMVSIGCGPSSASAQCVQAGETGCCSGVAILQSFGTCSTPGLIECVCQ